MADDDAEFLAYLTERLGALPYVEAVALGGSRATGTHRADSDWDLAVYYRGAFSPDSVRDLGWPGEVSELGGWGGGVFNGGAWLTVRDRRVDVHYRDLDDVEHHLAEAREGRFRIERLLFHLVGVPTYIVLAELALNRVLRGDPPRPEYPEPLRRRAAERWRSEAVLTLDYARNAYAVRGRLAETAGAIAAASGQTAHAILAARGQWVTNEKTLLDRAGLCDIDHVLTGLTPDPKALTTAIDKAAIVLERAVNRPA